MDNARIQALEIVVDVLENGNYCNVSLNRCFDKKKQLDDRDKRFISMLSLGTIERAVELDYILSLYCKKPVNKLKPYIRNILRISVYQIKYMEQVPDRAAVNEAVKMTVRKGYGALKGYVNGVLRNIAGTINDIPYPDSKKEPVRYLSIVYSVPEWLVRHYIKELGYDDAGKTLRYFMDSHDVTIRCTGNVYNKTELADSFISSGIEVKNGEFFEYALKLNNPGAITGLKGYKEGSFAVQDESSMIPSHIADKLLDKGGSYNVLDICAAPGGKSMQLAASRDKKVHIDARDISEEKTALIADNAKRLNIDNISISAADALITDMSCMEKYDIVIADLPCSGLGVLAKKNDIKYNVSEEGMKELALMQEKILDITAGYVKANGYIVFSTCTLNRCENEDNVGIFLEKHNNFENINLKKYVPKALEKFITADGMVKVIPGKACADGFFVAVLKRKL